MESQKLNWERVRSESLGEGGQSKVFLVRTPQRTEQRKHSLDVINSHVPTAISFTTAEEKSSINVQFAEAILDYTQCAGSVGIHGKPLGKIPQLTI
jgi:hypothetical protein